MIRLDELTREEQIAVVLKLDETAQSHERQIAELKAVATFRPSVSGSLRRR